jgi:hypothetical protein
LANFYVLDWSSRKPQYKSKISLRSLTKKECYIPAIPTSRTTNLLTYMRNPGMSHVSSILVSLHGAEWNSGLLHDITLRRMVPHHVLHPFQQPCIVQGVTESELGFPGKAIQAPTALGTLTCPQVVIVRRSTISATHVSSPAQGYIIILLKSRVSRSRAILCPIAFKDSCMPYVPWIGFRNTLKVRGAKY